MCLRNEQVPVRLTKDEIYYKVFSLERYSKILNPNNLLTIHNRTKILSSHAKANKKFSNRKGYQVFKERASACAYRRALAPSNTAFLKVKRVLVRKGALEVTGVIGYGYTWGGRGATRVSSYEILDWTPTE